MSHKALSWAWSIQGLPSTQKFLLVALADFADEMHSCYPGQEKLAGMVGVQRQAVSKNLGELEAAGFISRSRRSRSDGSRSSDRFVLSVGFEGQRTESVRTPDGGSMSAKQGGMNNQRTTSKNPPIVPQVSSELALAGEGDRFDEFWSVYPLKKDKGTARRAFARALKKVSADVLVDAASAYRDDPNRDPGFTKYPASWLNAEAWENGALPPRGGRPGVVEAGRQADAVLRARAAEQAAIEGDA